MEIDPKQTSNKGNRSLISELLKRLHPASKSQLPSAEVLHFPVSEEDPEMQADRDRGLSAAVLEMLAFIVVPGCVQDISSGDLLFYLFRGLYIYIYI